MKEGIGGMVRVTWPHVTFICGDRRYVCHLWWLTYHHLLSLIQTQKDFLDINIEQLLLTFKIIRLSSKLILHIQTIH